MAKKKPRRRGPKREKPADGPPEPPGEARAGEEDDRIPVREVHENVEAALAEGGLTEAQKDEYRAAIRVVIGRLTPLALARVQAEVREYKFYKSWQELTDAIRRKYPKMRIKGTIKGALDRDGSLHLNGGGTLFGRPAKLEEFYAHEITHAIDGRGHEISNSPEWQEAWKAEIQDGAYLGPDSSRSPQEGFGEFGAMLLGSGTSADQVEEVMPRCVHVWKERGIL